MGKYIHVNYIRKHNFFILQTKYKNIRNSYQANILEDYMEGQDQIN